MKKLITGGSGLIGSQFRDGIKVSSKDYDLLKETDVIKMYQDHQPEVVIHTAAKVGGLGANMNYLGDFFYQNVKMNNEVVHYAKEYGVKKFIGFTSTCVFPHEIEYPLQEDKMHDGPPHPSNYAYAHAKRMLDTQIQAYNDQFGTQYFTVIPTNIYGPKDNFNLENSHVIPGLIHKVYLAMKSNQNVEVWGTGKPLREFLFSRDVAEICDILVDKYTDTKPIILSPSYETSIEEAVTTICDIFGFKNKIIFDSSKPDGQFRKPSDNSHLMSIIGDYKFTPFREGLEETIEWFLQTYPNIRQ